MNQFKIPFVKLVVKSVLVGSISALIAVTASAQTNRNYSAVLGTGAIGTTAAAYTEENYPTDMFGSEVNDWLEHGYSTPANWGASTPKPIKIMIKNNYMRNPTSLPFVDTLNREKSRLMAMYNLTNSEYNRLAVIAFGILGRESNLSIHPRYWGKENFPETVVMAKEVLAQLRNWREVLARRELIEIDVEVSSRGPTQIKNIPVDIARVYRVTPDNLRRPEKAAVATVGFLAERLREMRTRVRVMNLTYINEINIYDYILYAYQGNLDEIFEGTATPARNIYLQTVRRFIQNLVLLEQE